MNRLSFILLCFLLLASSCVKEVGEDLESSLPTPPKEEGKDEKPTRLMNLLKNGDCEKWCDRIFISASRDYLDGWSLKENHGSLSQERNIVCEGKYSAKLHSPQTGITAFISQKVKINPGHRIRLYFSYLLEGYSGTPPRMYCYIRENGTHNIANNILREFYDDATLCVIRGGGYGQKSFPVCKGEWQVFDYTIQMPAIAEYFVFEIHSYAGTVLYIDDCYVVDVDL